MRSDVMLGTERERERERERLLNDNVYCYDYIASIVEE